MFLVSDCNTLSDYKLDRTLAVIITKNGEIYESDANHQECFLNYKRDFFKKYEIDLLNTYGENYDNELGEAIEVTNSLFQKNEFYGFDVFSNLENEFFISHYPQNLEECYNIARTYADANEYELATFISTTNLSDKFRIIYDYKPFNSIIYQRYNDKFLLYDLVDCSLDILDKRRFTIFDKIIDSLEVEDLSKNTINDKVYVKNMDIIKQLPQSLLDFEFEEMKSYV